MIILWFFKLSLAVEKKYYNQIVDHFNLQSPTFKQKYYVNQNYAEKSKNIILYIGGAKSLDETSVTTGPILEIAEKTKSVIIGLEHRYFGESVPTPNMSIFNIQYCSVPQANLDLKTFISKPEIRENYCLDQNTCKFFLMGEGYAGGLATWISGGISKYYIGAWASSSQLVCINNFTQYDSYELELLGKISESCPSLVQNAYKAIEKILLYKNDTTLDMVHRFGIKHEHNFSIEDPADFLYMVSEAVSRGIKNSSHYNDIKKMCSELKFKNEEQIVDIMSKYANIFVPSDEFIMLWPAYVAGPELNDLRAYYHIKCHDLGAFPTSSGKLRSPRVNSWYFDNVCTVLFHRSLPDEIIFNNLHKGVDPRADRVFFTSGTRDPGIKISCTKEDKNQDRFAKIIPDGGYGEDIRAALPGESITITEARKSAVEQAVKWINDSKQLTIPLYFYITIGILLLVILILIIAIIVICKNDKVNTLASIDSNVLLSKQHLA